MINSSPFYISSIDLYGYVSDFIKSIIIFVLVRVSLCILKVLISHRAASILISRHTGSTGRDGH